MEPAFFLVLALHFLGNQEVESRPTKCHNLNQAMATCMVPVGGGSPLQPGGGHKLLSDLNATKTLCQEGKMQEAMSCLEEMYNECVEEYKARNQQPNDLNLMLDVGKWRSGIEKLCNNIDYLMQHEECSEKITVESSHCIQAKSRTFQKELALLVPVMKTDSTATKKMMNLGCKFAIDVIACFKTPLDLEQSCPCRYRQLVVDVVAESMPPFCSIHTDYYNSYQKCQDAMEEEEEEDTDDMELDEGMGYEDDMGDVQYGGYSIADPSKIKVFDGDEFVEGSLFHRYGHLGYGESEKDQDQWPGIYGQAPTYETAVKDELESSVSEFGQTQGHTGQAASVSCSGMWLVVATVVYGVSLFFHW